MANNATEKIRTGISQLDDIIGGFPKGKTVLLTGDPGTGKTIFGLQFAFTSSRNGLKTTYISTEESAEDLILQSLSFNWNIEGLMNKKLLNIIELAGHRAINIETTMMIRNETLKGNFLELLDHIPVDTDVLIIDSIGNHTANLSVSEFRDRFDLLIYTLTKKKITSLIILDSVTSKDFNDVALFSSHGAIQLMKRENPYIGRRERAMDIVKMRNTRTPIDFITYEITTNGIEMTSMEKIPTD